MAKDDERDPVKEQPFPSAPSLGETFHKKRDTVRDTKRTPVEVPEKIKRHHPAPARPRPDGALKNMADQVDRREREFTEARRAEARERATERTSKREAREADKEIENSAENSVRSKEEHSEHKPPDPEARTRWFGENRDSITRDKGRDQGGDFER